MAATCLRSSIRVCCICFACFTCSACFTCVPMSHASPASPVLLFTLLQARHAGRVKLQQDLWERSQARHHSRVTPHMAAGLSNVLVKELDAVQGHKVASWIPGESHLLHKTAMDGKLLSSVLVLVHIWLNVCCCALSNTHQPAGNLLYATHMHSFCASHVSLTLWLKQHTSCFLVCYASSLML